MPEDLESLRNQRIRWQRGLAESLWPNLGLMFSRRSGVLGWLSFPFMLLFEFIGPLIELLGYVVMTVLLILGLVSGQIFLIFLIAAIGIGVLLSINALLLEELSYRMYPKLSQQLKLLAWAVLENFGYRQLTAVWRVTGLMRWAFSARRHVRRWGKIRRDGSWQVPDAVESRTAPQATASDTSVP